MPRTVADGLWERPEPDPSYSNKDLTFMITKTFTRKNRGKVFVITGISGLPDAAALRVGLWGRKRSGRRAGKIDIDRVHCRSCDERCLGAAFASDGHAYAPVRTPACPP